MKQFVNILAVLLLLSSVCCGVEPPKKPCLFGMQEQCQIINGRRVCAQRQPVFRRNVVSRPPVMFGLQMAAPVIVAPPVVMPTEVEQTAEFDEREIEVPKTVFVDEEIEVTVMRPVKETRIVKKPVTVMEKKTVRVQKPVTVSAPMCVQAPVCVCETTFAPVCVEPTFFDPCATQTVSSSGRRRGLFGLFSRRSVRVPTRASQLIHQPPGQNLAFHLRRDHGINTRGMSRAQMLEIHTQIHRAEGM